MNLTFEEFLNSEALQFENCKDILQLLQTEYEKFKTQDFTTLEVLDLINIVANDTLHKVILMGLSVNAKKPEGFEVYKEINKEQVRFLLQLIRSIKNSIYDEETKENS